VAPFTPTGGKGEQETRCFKGIIAKRKASFPVCHPLLKGSFLTVPPKLVGMEIGVSIFW
jgi:hypothetical protein